MLNFQQKNRAMERNKTVWPIPKKKKAVNRNCPETLLNLLDKDSKPAS